MATPEDRNIKVDAGGKPIPQRWDPDTENFVEYTGKELPTGAATEAKQDAIATLMGALASAAVTDPTASANQIALLKGIIKQLQGDGSGAMPVSLTGSTVEIGGVSFAVSGGDTLRNTAANKPNAEAAHAAIPFCYYYAVDTGVVEVTDGTNWVVI